MKNKKLKTMLSGALVLCMMLALFGGAAYADTSISCTVNQNLSDVVVYNGSSNIVTCSYVGDLPAGLNLSFRGTSIYISGAASTAGSYSFQLNMQTEAGAESCTVNINVADTVQQPVASPETTLTPVETSKPVNNNNSKPVITKHPTSETVAVGESAAFVARADYADEFTWRIVSPDTTNTYKASEASWYFKGLEVSGVNTEKLVLSNIPKSMNGWAVECMFKNGYGYSFTNGAVIYISGETSKTNDPTVNTNTKPAEEEGLKKPTVTGAVTKAEDSGKLSITASNPNPGLGTLTYQWYSADTADTGSMKAIDGANGSSYTIPESGAAKYYRVGVWVSKDGEKSETVYSDFIENTPKEELPPVESASPSPSAAPTPLPTPVPTPEDGGDSYNRDGSSTLIFYVVVAGLALVAVAGILIYLVVSSAKGKKYDDEDEDS